MSDFRAELAEFLEHYPNIQYIDTLLPDTNGIVRGKRFPVSAARKLDKGCYFPGSVFSLDITGTTIEDTGLGLDIGDPDRHCRVVPGTLAPSAVDPERIGQVLLTMLDEEGERFLYEPRNLLANLIDSYTVSGYKPVVALELEFYLIDPKRDEQGDIQPPIGYLSGEREIRSQLYTVDGLDDFSGFLSDVNELAQLQGIPADTAIAEASPGQFEINLRHCDDPVAACDHAVLLKRLIRSVARRYNYEATFMAKPYAEFTGNGLHIHTSLLDQFDRNVFSLGDGQDSDTLHQAIAGSLALMPDTVALLCPNVNSYRRMAPDMYVPLNASWGHNNRTVSLRIPFSDGGNRRIEHRLAGADANPYIALSVVLAGILYGIENKLTPPDAVTGNGLNQTHPVLPCRPAEALACLNNSKELPNYLSKEFLDTYVVLKQNELRQFEQHITRLEMDWLLTTA
ncbi:glutamine synthetase family protein [Endozoicomonas lisbonensis]|uniref:Gamma-glutamylputrescine synthase n=2 Tax=Endozoicomonas lisbonensis TaxID=3120522 RepID=A0ABV2SDL7_9GAMM